MGWMDARTFGWIEGWLDRWMEDHAVVVSVADRLWLQIASAGGSLISQALFLIFRCSRAAFCNSCVNVAVLLVLQQQDCRLGIFSLVLAPSFFLLLLLLLIS